MLNDREREILHEMQRQFVTEDPDFARSFEEAGRRDSHYSLQWAYQVPRWVYTTALVVSVTLSVLMLLALAPWTALVFMTLAIMIAMARFHRDDEERQVSAPRSGVDHPTSGHTRQARPDHRRCFLAVGAGTRQHDDPRRSNGLHDTTEPRTASARVPRPVVLRQE